MHARCQCRGTRFKMKVMIMFLSSNFQIIYNKGWTPKLNESAIFAQCDGVVRYTTEIFVPAPGTVEARTIEKLPKGAFIYKLHCHVVPEPQSTHFEMKSFL